MGGLDIENNRIIKLGGEVDYLPEARYIGLIKMSSLGVYLFKEVYNSNPEQFSQICMTDFLQLMISLGHIIYSSPIRKGWIEIDSKEDYENLLQWDEEGISKDLIRL